MFQVGLPKICFLLIETIHLDFASQILRKICKYIFVRELDMTPKNAFKFRYFVLPFLL